ncbi:MAG: hypothetical protein LBG64_02690 [Pseudomonadales bacterium]|jgi:hypothetical protein|nr:hypothetical protein [Pseudomonadales bacterium]
MGFMGENHRLETTESTTSTEESVEERRFMVEPTVVSGEVVCSEMNLRIFLGERLSDGQVEMFATNASNEGLVGRTFFLWFCEERGWTHGNEIRWGEENAATRKDNPWLVKPAEWLSLSGTVFAVNDDDRMRAFILSQEQIEIFFSEYSE